MPAVQQGYCLVQATCAAASGCCVWAAKGMSGQVLVLPLRSSGLCCSCSTAYLGHPSQTLLLFAAAGNWKTASGHIITAVIGSGVLSLPWSFAQVSHCPSRCVQADTQQVSTVHSASSMASLLLIWGSRTP